MGYQGEFYYEMITLQFLYCHGSKVTHVTEHAHKVAREKSEKMSLASTVKPKYRTAIDHKGWKQQRLRRVLLLKYREGVEHKGLKQQRLRLYSTTARQRSLCSMQDNLVQAETAHAEESKRKL